MILPGITGYESIVLSHHLAPPQIRTGGDWDNNEAGLDINEVGHAADGDFVVNVTHNGATPFIFYQLLLSVADLLA